MKKILILGSFLIFLCLIFTKSICAQGTCTARKNIVTQSCELDSNNCQNHYWVHEVNNICDCDCVECTNNNHCPTGYTCAQHICQAPPQQSYCGRSCWGNEANCGDPCPHCVPYAGGSWCQAEETPVVSPATGPGGGEGGSIRTAIGDIDPRNLQGFIQSLLGIAFGVAGGIAFLLMLFGSFQIMTSSGNPEKMKSGSELITSALTGLLFIIFSVFILKLIGVTILEIPGFGQ